MEGDRLARMGWIGAKFLDPFGKLFAIPLVLNRFDGDRQDA
jgi:hypothetical protein